MPSTRPHPLHDPVTRWYAEQARTLPWRSPAVDGWAVLVSEVMLQQTPVARVLPAYTDWMARWPTPAELAACAAGDAVRAWGRLGYPRRALRLHGAAVMCVERFGGAVPSGYDDLRTLPGVGDYTAAAVASFAYAQRHVVLDTNVRRVLARLVGGVEYPPEGGPVAAERAVAAALLPDVPAEAARWNVAVMELGALVCTARSPRCADCPVAARCRWLLGGKPRWDGAARRGQTYAGTDRAVRGKLLAVLRDHPGPVARVELEPVWAEAVQRERCLDSLVADGLVTPLTDDLFTLPT